METIIRNVRDLPTSERTAFERLVGHALEESQQIMLKVLDAAPPSEPLPPAGIPEYWRVFEGLDDERVEELTAAIHQRCNLTRTFE